MGIEVIIEFIAKTTVRVIAYVYDDDGSLVNPTTSIKVTIYDPDGDPQVEGVAMSATADTGIFEYYYKTDADTTKGWWRGEVAVIDGTSPNDRTSMGTFSFKVR